MTPRERVALIVGLSIIIWMCVWLLANRLRHHLRMQRIRDQEVREREMGEGTSRSELWPWPPRGKYEPGEWAGPIKALEGFLHRLRLDEQISMVIDKLRQQGVRIKE